MKLNIKKTTIETILISFTLILFVFVFILPLGIAPNNVSLNYKNVTVWTHVNITNAKPEVLNVTIFEATNSSARNITIAAGSVKTVYCNATVRDWNGYNDIIYANASLWYVPTSNSNATDDNNSHYTNVSCTLNASTSTNVGWYICSFDVLYYANNGTWSCNVTVMDTLTKTGSLFNTTVFYPVYALNVTDGIDYGNVAVESYSSDVNANITNLGNMAINISVEGYGARRGDNLAMNCSDSGNISVQYEKYGLASGLDYTTGMTALNSSLGGLLISNLTMPKQNTSTQIINATYWKLYIPPNPAGNCTGYIIFTALAP